MNGLKRGWIGIGAGVPGAASMSAMRAATLATALLAPRPLSGRVTSAKARSLLTRTESAMRSGLIALEDRRIGPAGGDLARPPRVRTVQVNSGSPSTSRTKRVTGVGSALTS